jgi:hypothetical protein
MEQGETSAKMHVPPQDMNAHKMQPAACGVCSKEFNVRVCDLKRGRGKTCSRRCRGKWSQIQRHEVRNSIEAVAHPERKSPEAEVSTI